MNAPTTINQLFAPLGERLHVFEMKQQGLADYGDDYFDLSTYKKRTPLIYSIARGIDNFDPVTVIEEAKYYEVRIADILKELEPIPSITIDFGDFKEVMKIEEKYQQIYLGLWKEELAVYSKHLLNFQTNASKRISITPVKSKEEQVPIQSTEIQLPNNFKVESLNQYFKGIVSQDHVALLFYYFKEKKIMPNFTNVSMGKLAVALFGRSQKNVTTSIRKIHDIRQNEKILLEFKDILLSLVNDVDEDLKEAR